MQSVFDAITRQGLLNRIGLLNENSRAQWGRMNVYQMLHHCILCEEMYLGKTIAKRTFIGRIFGQLALKNMLKDDKPLRRNAPTNRTFIVKEAGTDLPAEKAKWITLMEEYAHYSNQNFEHWFFGKMTREQVGQFVFKHADHHLRQFGV